MLIDVSLKAEIVKNNNKDHKNVIKYILNPLMPKIT